MTNKHPKRLLSFIVSLAMVSSLALTPASAEVLEGSINLGSLGGSSESSAVEVVTSSGDTSSDTSGDTSSDADTGAQESDTAASDAASDTTDSTDATTPAEATTTETTTETTKTTTASGGAAAASVSASSDSIAASKLQKKIGYLPTVDEAAEMDSDELAELYSYVSDLWDDYYELTEDEQAEVDTTALEELSDYFNGAIMLTVAEDAVAEVYDTSDNKIGSYTSLSDAYTAVKNYSGGTIKLTSDITGEKIKVTGAYTFTLDLNGKTLDTGSNVAVLTQDSSASVTIKDSSDDGKITSTNTTAVVYSTAGTINIESGTITGATTSATSLVRTGGDDAAITVDDGTFSGYYIFRADAGTITVNGGTFTSATDGSIVYDVANATATGDESGSSTSTAGASLVITDGYFNSSKVFRTSGEDITVTGGYFTVSDDNLSRLNNYIAKGYTVTEETVGDTQWYTVGKGNFTVEYYDDDNNLQIRKSYTTLDKAVRAATSGDIILMNADSDSGFKLNSDISLTLDLNGRTISGTADEYMISVASGTLTIIDSSTSGTGTITGTISTSTTTTGIVRNVGGTLDIKSGEIKVSSGNAVNAYGGTTTISGGKISGDITANSTLTVTGGYFTEDLTGKGYLADGYAVAEKTDADYPYLVTELATAQNTDLTSGKIQLKVSITAPDATAAMTFGDDDTATALTAEDGVFTIDQNVNASEMSDELVITLTFAEDYTYEYKTSVREYAEAVLATLDNTSDANKISVIKSMLDYGTAVKELVDSLSTSDDTDTTGTSSADYYNNLSGISADTILNAGITKKTATTGTWSEDSPTLQSMNMNVGSDFNIILIYSTSLDNYSVTATIGGTGHDVTVSGTRVTIEDLSAEDLMKRLAVTISTKDTNGEVISSYTTNTYGIYYARLVLANDNASSVTNQQKLVAQAMYQYALALDTYTSTSASAT